jgi:hypothetical protein
MSLVLTEEQKNNVLYAIHEQAILPDIYNEIEDIYYNPSLDRYLVRVSHDSKPYVEELHMEFDWCASHAPYALEAEWSPLHLYTDAVYPDYRL